ncbi:hypothetical protein ACI6Q2_02275 [Chitinophagaceae bacterium LWZ2-11]
MKFRIYLRLCVTLNRHLTLRNYEPIKPIHFNCRAFQFFTSCNGQNEEKNKDIETSSDKFRVGQVWKYNNRAGEDSSTLTILKIEKYEKGDTIIHIRID